MDSHYQVSFHLFVQTTVKHMNRFHYQEYLFGCKEKGIEPKACPPAHFKSDNQFVSMTRYLLLCLVDFFQDAGEDGHVHHHCKETTSHHKVRLKGVFA